MMSQASSSPALLARTQQMTDPHRLLVDARSDFALFTLDPAGTITSWNTGGEQLMGQGQHLWCCLATVTSGEIMKTRILLNEDNPHNRYMTAFLLGQRGYEVIQAKTGAQGLQLAAEVCPHLILLDIQLPGVDGYTVARALKRDPQVQPIPIVAVTSYAMAGDREKCLASGAEGYIEKPINSELFVAEVEQFLRSSASKPATDR